MADMTVFVLTRTSYLDDYKLRGENPSSMVCIGAYATKELACIAESKDQTKFVLERFDGSGDRLEELYGKYLLGPDCIGFDEDFEDFDEEAIFRDVDSGDLDLDIVLEGEFVPILYEWAISELKVIY
jgi:hypothetical protein